ncbi:carnitine dehydratase [Novosphingobium sp. PC22D]|uniref:CaiB/BaiF CoA transferase family protein n=1 Tax=Novosphingobium sp. PC22D TaxID=1962403 RepID=UPI000BF12872|nr:CoA transferase [Novosphingobium sp. PC22D]PEQ10393.1 carnitine dehydratase [Novosphingobium sp. PC22D]
MGKPLEGIKVVEVAMWAFVPACGGMLADLGADVIKVEPPSGDPLRGLQIGNLNDGAGRRIDYSWESYNRGKRSITLDLKQESGRAVLMKLLASADVFLTNLLPPARRAMAIDAATIRAAFPGIIYASGSALGPKGPEADKGGYDAITFWSRGGISSALTEADAALPVGPPGPAFGDTLSGSMLAGAICAAIARRALTGEAGEVDVSLLGSAMWSMQRYICQATADNVQKFPRPSGPPFNVLVGTYRTSDGRFLALCMLQADKYWAPFCEVAGRPDLAADPRFADAPARRENAQACWAEVTALFASRTLAEWREILARQDGQWDVVKDVGEMRDDPQALANGYLKHVDYGDGSEIPMVGVPMVFDGEPLGSTRSPELGADSDAILESLGYDEDAIIDLKVQGVVF